MSSKPLRVVRWVGVGLFAGIVMALSVLSAQSSNVAGRWLAAAVPPFELLDTRELTTPFQTELEWIAGTVTRNIAAMCLAAREPGGRLPEGFVVRVAERSDTIERYGLNIEPGNDLPSLVGTYALPTNVWWPGDYADVARTVRAQWCPAPAVVPPASAAPAAPAVMTALLQLDPAVIVAQSQALSARLSANMLDAAAHDEAALLLGAFALREAAGPRTDVRHTLSRATAHLAFARVLDAAGGPARRYAEVLLLAHAGRNIDALDGLKTLEARPDAAAAPYAPWNRALRLRLTQDWRLLPAPASASLLERLEYFRARVATTARGTRVVTLMAPIATEPLPDWGRLAVDHRLSVANGHRFVSRGLEPELAEIAHVWRLTHDTPPPASLAEMLNEPASDLIGGDGVRVIGWGTWSAFLQRHLVHHVDRVDRFYARTLGLPAEARKFEAQMDAQLMPLDLYPAMRLWRSQEAANVSDCTTINEVIARARRAPHLLNATNWELVQGCAQYALGKGWKEPSDWFVPVTLRTPFEAGRRVTAIRGRYSADAYEALVRVGGYEHTLVKLYFDGRFTKETDPASRQAVVTRVLGARLDYDVRARQLAETYLTGAAWRTSRIKTCELDIESCYDLAADYARSGEEEQAAALYERVLADEAIDEVGAANRTEWLAGYYRRRGSTAKADALAARAASTYSAAGLLMQARHAESKGDFDTAEAFFLRNEERYRAPAETTGFYHRMARQRGQAAYAPKLQAALARLFPDGMRRFDQAEATGEPARGVHISSSSAAATRADIRRGDVIVALDGWYVTDVEQYVTVRGFVDEATPVDLVIWRRGEGWLRRRVTVPGRRFGVELHAYPLP